MPSPIYAVPDQQITDITAKLPDSLGAKLAEASLAVVLPTDGILPLPTGAATDLALSAIEQQLVTPNIRALTASDVVTVAALPVTIASDIAAIKVNTAKISQFAFQLAEDSAGTVFLIKTDTIVGTSANINVATGNPFTPVGAIELTDPSSSALQIEPNEFEAITTLAGNWATGDILTRILIVNTATTTVSATLWQSAVGVALATIPVVGTDVIDADRQMLSILRSIDLKTPALGQALAAASQSVVLPIAQIAALTPPSNTGYALDTSINNLLKPSSTLAAVTIVGAIVGALPTGGNTIGSISNASFGISGTLPQFATTPTVNLGTIAGVATAARQPALGTAGIPSSDVITIQGAILGTPLPVNLSTPVALASTDYATIAFGTIATSTLLTGAFAGGTSVCVEIDVTAISGAATQSIVRVYRTLNGNDQLLYTFEPITVANGARVYRSPYLPSAGSSLRVVETVTGTTPSITRSIARNISHLAVNTAIGSRRSNVFNLLNAGIDLPLYGRTRRLTASNRSAVLHYLQIHDKPSIVVTGDIPVEVFQLPATSTLPFTVADLGEFGSVLGAATNPRIAISTTFNTYTAPVAIVANLLHLFVESL